MQLQRSQSSLPPGAQNDQPQNAAGNQEAPFALAVQVQQSSTTQNAGQGQAQQAFSNDAGNDL